MQSPREILPNCKLKSPMSKLTEIMTEVMVFRTSVESAESVLLLKPSLDLLAGAGRWNFALDDSDRVLRVKATRDKLESTVMILNSMGYQCEELED